MRRGIASRSFTDMRVEVVEKIASRIERSGVSTGEVAPTLAIKNFLTAIESDDSLFCVAQPLAGPAMEESKRGCVSSGDMVLEFRQAEHRRQRALHFLLLEKLIELLREAGSREAVGAALCLTSGNIPMGTEAGEDKPTQKELALWLRLDATGDSPEQAMLRWGLGLTHFQQALLFVSRHLRLHLSLRDK